MSGSPRARPAPPPAPADAPPPASGERKRSFFAFLFGGFLGLAVVKFGNPPILEPWVSTPETLMEYLFYTPWPAAWAYWLLFGLAVFGVWVADRAFPPRQTWVLGLLLGWLGWQFLAAKGSVDPALTAFTLRHLISCASVFLLGYFCLGRLERLGWFWPGILAGFLIMIGVGWNQHFGGLEETREYFRLYLYPQMKDLPLEYLKKLSSTRIFGTVFYPNALAGALLLLGPPILALTATARERFTLGARVLLAALLSAGALACLYWSGSKGGWLLMLLLGVIALLHGRFSNRAKAVLVGAVLVCGLAGFGLKYAGFFRRGATSVTARFDYWRAAAQTAAANPLFGTGPGTFFAAYSKIKKPESEPSRLVHNDYLEQASDAGLPAFVLWTAFLAAALVWSYPRMRRPARASSSGYWVRLGLWLGVLGWALQSCVEFGLYIPALAWPALAGLGFLLRQAGHAEAST